MSIFNYRVLADRVLIKKKEKNTFLNSFELKPKF